SLAARQYARNISMFSYLFGIGMGMGRGIIMRGLLAVGEKDEPYEHVWKRVKGAAGVTLCMDALVLTLRTQLMGLFTHNPLIITLGASVLL
ncbi:MATE family efflux transporter, partial [Bacillus sp. GbtcB14]|uniref:MATE family efflux transporter n=1 Tax=Bacillus sp. GbtcB14 TaxID=2824759 RepID=UPI0020C67E48